MEVREVNQAQAGEDVLVEGAPAGAGIDDLQGGRRHCVGAVEGAVSAGIRWGEGKRIEPVFPVGFTARQQDRGSDGPREDFKLAQGVDLIAAEALAFGVDTGEVDPAVRGHGKVTDEVEAQDVGVQVGRLLLGRDGVGTHLDPHQVVGLRLHIPEEATEIHQVVRQQDGRSFKPAVLEIAIDLVLEGIPVEGAKGEGAASPAEVEDFAAHQIIGHGADRPWGIGDRDRLTGGKVDPMDGFGAVDGEEIHLGIEEQEGSLVEGDGFDVRVPPTSLVTQEGFIVARAAIDHVEGVGAGIGSDDAVIGGIDREGAVTSGIIAHDGKHHSCHRIDFEDFIVVAIEHKQAAIAGEHQIFTVGRQAGGGSGAPDRGDAQGGSAQAADRQGALENVVGTVNPGAVAFAENPVELPVGGKGDSRHHVVRIQGAGHGLQAWFEVAHVGGIQGVAQTEIGEVET